MSIDDKKSKKHELKEPKPKEYKEKNKVKPIRKKMK
jgi:hypothetical protein